LKRKFEAQDDQGRKVERILITLLEWDRSTPDNVKRTVHYEWLEHE
jgi:hypothetical protein